MVKMGISSEKQRLTSNGEQLKDDRTLKSYIQNKSILQYIPLQIVIESRYQLKPRSLSAESIKLEVESSNTIKDVKAKI